MDFHKPNFEKNRKDKSQVDTKVVDDITNFTISLCIKNFNKIIVDQSSINLSRNKFKFWYNFSIRCKTWWKLSCWLIFNRWVIISLHILKTQTNRLEYKPSCILTNCPRSLRSSFAIEIGLYYSLRISCAVEIGL